MSKKKNISYIS
jgi:hypothetical protein